MERRYLWHKAKDVTISDLEERRLERGGETLGSETWRREATCGTTPRTPRSTARKRDATYGHNAKDVTIYCLEERRYLKAQNQRCHCQPPVGETLPEGTKRRTSPSTAWWRDATYGTKPRTSRSVTWRRDAWREEERRLDRRLGGETLPAGTTPRTPRSTARKRDATYGHNAKDVTIYCLEERRYLKAQNQRCHCQPPVGETLPEGTKRRTSPSTAWWRDATYGTKPRTSRSVTWRRDAWREEERRLDRRLGGETLPAGTTPRTPRSTTRKRDATYGHNAKDVMIYCLEERRYLKAQNQRCHCQPPVGETLPEGTKRRTSTSTVCWRDATWRHKTKDVTISGLEKRRYVWVQWQGRHHQPPGREMLFASTTPRTSLSTSCWRDAARRHKTKDVTINLLVEKCNLWAQRQGRHHQLSGGETLPKTKDVRINRLEVRR